MIKSIKPIVLQIAILLLAILLVTIFKNQYTQWFAAIGFPKLQVLRSTIFGASSLSVGDMAYSVAAAFLIFLGIKRYRNTNFKKKSAWAIILLKATRAVLFIGLAFYLLWSALYAQPKLSTQMSLGNSKNINNTMLMNFDASLIQRMNKIVSSIDSLPYAQVNNIAAAQYHQSGIGFPMRVKPSLFGTSLAYLGIEGYFNPFTGEAQANAHLPNFMLPFVLTHELAHQAGIAAEDDANLMAYIRCVGSKDSSFRYSAYLNIWLYTHRKVWTIDSAYADSLTASLNATSLAHLAILKKRNAIYQNFLNNWSSVLFDAFLKMGNQKDGISSYRNVAYDALLWEQQQAANIQPQ
ncbi:MAG: DUF3810 family protein [Chitinophagaceae bacterium]|nr:DUF3810 family protein [Chitinophagaceae bacterium]